MASYFSQSESIQLIKTIKLTSNQTFSLPEMDVAKADLPNQTYQNNSTKPNLPILTYQTKPTKLNHPYQI